MTKTLPGLLIAAVVFAAGGMSCSGSTTKPKTVTQTVDTQGATLELDGATVTFPSGAVSSPLSVTITETDLPPPADTVAFSKIYSCEPSGTNFAQPVTMTMKFTGDGTTPTMYWSSGTDPTFKDVGGSPVGDSFSATVMHFSSGFVGRKSN
jgi:hypothetical protein